MAFTPVRLPLRHIRSSLKFMAFCLNLTFTRTSLGVFLVEVARNWFVAFQRLLLTRKLSWYRNQLKKAVYLCCCCCFKASKFNWFLLGFLLYSNFSSGSGLVMQCFRRKAPSDSNLFIDFDCSLVSHSSSSRRCRLEDIG